MEELFVDTQELRSCLTDISEQKRLCTALAEHLSYAQTIATPEDMRYFAQFRELTEDIERYLQNEQQALEHTCDLFERTAQEIEDMIGEVIHNLNEIP